MTRDSIDGTTIGTPHSGGVRPLGAASHGIGPGTKLGNFVLLEQLGAGGMGRVFVADQTSPVQRRVAVKLLEAQVLSVRNLARFDVERQALAQMNHPAIAQVYDAGTTDDGWPWFAMELVTGHEIDTYVEFHSLDLKQRVELLIRVCRGVQHAHIKGILHRDLKPGNILVSEIDAVGAPKIIDFGIASAVSSGSDDERGHSLGTPAYMSPEQAADSANVDQRTDVYSLGMVLYELLTGGNPRAGRAIYGLDSKRLQQKLIDTPIEAPSRKSKQLRINSELDAITLKALAVDREQRYQSVADLAEDLQNYLQQRPVAAVSASAGYIARKLIQRHSLLVGTAAAVSLALIVAAGAVTYSLVETRAAWLEAEKRRAETEQIASFQQRLITGLDPYSFGGALREALLAQLQRTARDDDGDLLQRLATRITRADATDFGRVVLDEQILAQASHIVATEFADQPLLSAKLLESLSLMYASVGLQEKAVQLAYDARDRSSAELGEQHADTLRLSMHLGSMLYSNSSFEESAAESRRVEALREHTDPADSLTLQMTLARLAIADFQTGNRETSASLVQRLFELPTLDPEVELMLLAQQRIALSFAGEHAQALTIAQRQYALAEQRHGPTHRITINSLVNLAIAQALARNEEDSIANLQRVISLLQESLGHDHPRTLEAMSNLATTYLRMGKPQQARALLEETLQLGRQVYRPDQPTVQILQNNLAAAMMQADEHEEARPILEQLWRKRRDIHGPAHPGTLSTLTNLADNLLKLGDTRSAREAGAELLEHSRQSLPEDHPQLQHAQALYARILAADGDYQQALPALRQSLEQRRAAHGERPAQEHDGTTLDVALRLLEVHLAIDDFEAARRIAAEPELQTLADPTAKFPRTTISDDTRARLSHALKKLASQPMGPL